MWFNKCKHRNTHNLFQLSHLTLLFVSHNLIIMIHFHIMTYRVCNNKLKLHPQCCTFTNKCVVQSFKFLYLYLLWFYPIIHLQFIWIWYKQYVKLSHVLFKGEQPNKWSFTCWPNTSGLAYLFTYFSCQYMQHAFLSRMQGYFVPCQICFDLSLDDYVSINGNVIVIVVSVHNYSFWLLSKTFS